MTNKYEIELNLNEQRMALMTMVDQLHTQYRTVHLKRSWRLSEKAMAQAQIARHIIALQMAVDRIDGMLKRQNEQYEGEGISSLMAG